MKKIIFVLVFLLGLVETGYALHITCDATNEPVTQYELDINGEIVPAPLQVVDEGWVRLWHDGAGLADGKYRIVARAGNIGGFWSPWSEELVFEIPYDANLSAPKSIQVSGVGKPGKISQEKWELFYVSSEETKNKGLLGTKAFDGDPKTQWHSSWLSSDPTSKHPHEIQIDLGKLYTISGFYYLPRQDVSWNGGVKKFKFYGSVDGVVWKELKSGELKKVKVEQFVLFEIVKVRYVSLVALSEVNGNTWMTVAEINVLGY